MVDTPNLETAPVASTSVEVVATPVFETVSPVVVAAEPSIAAIEAAEKSVEAVKAPEATTVLAEQIDKTKTPVPETPKVETPEVKPDLNKEEGQFVDPAPPTTPVYEAFKVPEDVTLDSERTKAFTDILSTLELDVKADEASKEAVHAKMQEFGQKAVDFHVNEIKRTVEDVNKLYQTSWERQKTEWKDAFLKDPEMGGNRFQTTVDSALSFIRTHGGSAEQQTEFRNLMEASGLGNHPAMIRILANAGRAMSEGQPLAASKPAPAPKSKTATLYGKSS